METNSVNEKISIIKKMAVFCFWIIAGYGLLYIFRRFFGMIYGPKKLVAFGLVFAVAAILQVKKLSAAAGGLSGYVKDTLGLPDKSKKRVGQYDWLRLFALSMVFINHGIKGDGQFMALEWGTPVKFWLSFVYVVCVSANVLYIMISGALLIPYKEEGILHFYLHRLTRVLIPLVLYYALYIWINHHNEPMNIESIAEYMRRLYVGASFDCPHFWLIYEIIALYVAVPFLRYLFKELPYKYVAAVYVITLISITLSKTLTQVIYAPPVFVSWTGVAIAGYFVSREETRKYDKLLMLCGVLSVIITGFVIANRPDTFELICCNLSPFCIMTGVGIMAAVFHFDKVFGKTNWLVSIVSKWSYPIILIHWIVIFIIVEAGHSMSVLDLAYVGGILRIILLTFIYSFIISFIYDGTVGLIVDKAVFALSKGKRK